MQDRDTDRGAAEDAPPASFEWPVYADATFAGLSLLIPVPLVDLLLERVFARRMPGAIAAHRKHPVDPVAVRRLNQSSFGPDACLLLPVWLVLKLAKRLFRTVLYFLTIKDATDSLSHHWHRAFLIDHALRRGHLDRAGHGTAAALVIRALLDEVTTSPARKLAAQVVAGARHVLRTALRRARSGVEDEVARAAHERMGRGWGALQASFAELAHRYDERFATLCADETR